MNLFTMIEHEIKAAASELEGVDPPLGALDRITAEPPRDRAHGDIATNAAMVLAKPLKTNPRALAQTLVEKLAHSPYMDSLSIAGPGFINIKLKTTTWHKVLQSICEGENSYGKSTIGHGKKINVEYVSANPTGPMHVGHCRGAVVGDSLANLLAFAGYDVTREYYVNDAGGQIDVLAKSLLLRYRQALGEAIEAIPEGLYPGEYLIEPGKQLAQMHGDALLTMKQGQQMEIAKRFAIDSMLDLIKSDLGLLKIRHDVFFSEKSLHLPSNQEGGSQSAIARSLENMKGRGLVYEGTLPPPKGEKPTDWEDREQTLFRATDFGDDIDRPLMKSDGSFTYFAADVAYCADKISRQFSRLIYVLGADHGGYVKRLQAVAKALAGDKVELDVILCQLVKLLRNGEPVTMSKRAGSFITLRDLVEEVGADAVRFMMLFRKAEAPLDFDFQKVTEQSRDNPVFYVQYAHARVCSVFRQASQELGDAQTGIDKIKCANLSLLDDAGEIALIAKLAEYPRIIEQAAKTDEPHRVAFYLYDLASAFHSHWNRGKENSHLRFINHDKAQLTLARLAMLHATGAVLKSGLGITGVDAPQNMH